jgi:hypothetical protein
MKAATIRVNDEDLAAADRPGQEYTDDNGWYWTSRGPDESGDHWWELRPAEPALEGQRPTLVELDEVAAYQAASDTGRVDFHELLKTDAQWKLKERLHAALGRPYLAVQLAQLLPADVCLRLADRVDQLVGPEVERRVSARLEEIHYEVAEQTTATLARLRADSDQKARELSDERFGTSSRLD